MRIASNQAVNEGHYKDAWEVTHSYKHSLTRSQLTHPTLTLSHTHLPHSLTRPPPRAGLGGVAAGNIHQVAPHPEGGYTTPHTQHLTPLTPHLTPTLCPSPVADAFLELCLVKTGSDMPVLATTAHSCIHTCIHIRIHIRIQLYTHVYTYTHAYTHTYTHAYTYAHMYVNMHMHTTCARTHAHTHAHSHAVPTHAHTHAHSLSHHLRLLPLSRAIG